MQVDPAAAVRRFLPEIIDGAVAANPCAPVLATCLACLQHLLGDSSAANARRALQSMYPAFRAAYAVVALHGGDAAQAAALRALWGAACALKLAVAAVAAEAGSSDAVRGAAVRFLEQAVLLLTAELVPAVPGISPAPTPLPPGNAVISKAALVRDAEAALAQLVALLKQQLNEQSTAPLVTPAVRAAGGIAQQRPQFIGRLLPPLLALAGCKAVKAAADGAAAGGGAAGGAAAMATALRAALLMLARSAAPAAKPWQKKIAAALEGLGAGAELQPQADGRYAGQGGGHP